MPPPRRPRLLTTVAALALAVVFLPAAPAEATTSYFPDTTLDEFDLTNGDLSLREAFALADADGDHSQIFLTPNATYQLTCGAHEGPLTHDEAGGQEDLSIDGDGTTIEQTCPDHRVMTVEARELILADLVVTGGDATTNGGGVLAVGAVLVLRSLITGNVDQDTTDNGGGGILAQGPVTVMESVVSGNEASTGGAIATITSGGDILVTDSSIVGNTVTGSVSGLSAVFDDITIVNSTVSGNTGDGAAVMSGGATTLTSATIAGNTASGGGGRALQVLGDLTSGHSVVAGNTVTTAECQVVGSTTESFVNVEGDTSCGFTAQGSQQNVPVDELALGPARDNGSPPTMYPLAGSILVDAIPADDCNGNLPTDERGVARPFPSGGSCDLGAVEQVYPPHGFPDVPAWVEAAVRWITSTVNDPPLMSGYPNTTFRPDQDITRAQVVRLLYREAGSPDTSGLPPHGLSDVPAWVQDAVTWAADTQIMTGYPDATFRPNLPITRAEVVRAKYRLAGSPDVSELPAHGFPDVPPWVETAVRWAANTDNSLPLTTGYPDNTFRPNLPITRAQVARLDYRLAITPAAWNDPATAPPTLPFVLPPSFGTAPGP